MRKAILTAMLLMAVAVSGCSKAAPACSDQRTIDLVKQIAQQKLDAKTPGTKAVFGLEAIRTTGKDDKTGTQSCAGDFTISLPEINYNDKTGITFTSELTDKNEHYVSVKGL